MWEYTSPHIPPQPDLMVCYMVFKKLPPFTFWHGTKAPILIIDEANEFCALVDDPDGKNALRNLFKWFILRTLKN